ncbi:MAG: acetolactate decarboxylase [Bacteroidota bacterium]
MPSIAYNEQPKEIQVAMKKEKNLHHLNYRGAFMSGYYEGTFPLSVVIENGNFGLGTFNNLDGEMVVLNGIIYRAKPDGAAEVIQDLSEYTPSAMVTYFKSEHEISFENLSTDDLKLWIAENLDTEKKMYALKVYGTFSELTARSQEKVTERPFPPINEIMNDMIYHDLKDIQGTLVGFQLPPYLENINYPGLHFHFVSNEMNQTQNAGCAPRYVLKKGILEIMEITSFSVDIPTDKAYDRMEIIPKKKVSM